LHPILGGPNEITSADSTPALPFGHGLSYTTFERDALSVTASVSAGDAFTATVRVRNTGERAGTDLVQLYARDIHASVTRPVTQLLGFARVELDAGAEATVSFDVPTSRLAFTGREGVRIVEPGDIELWVGPSCAERETEAATEIVGEVHRVTASDRRIVEVSIER
ncbi:MAG: glycosyl hydrolase, partial [Microbacterium sp.]|nr:glycosyl hydrolase [Microbacterium sp.]